MIMPDVLTSLTIGLHYLDDDCGAWSLADLCHNRGVMNPAHMDSAGLEQALGGLRCFHDRIFCFLSTEGRTDLLSNAWFLLQSLAVLAGDGAAPSLLDALPPREDERAVARLDHEDGSSLHLSRADGHLLLSFVDATGNALQERFSPYFEHLPIADEAWFLAAQEALSEYAMMARRVAGPRPESQTGPGRFLALWSLFPR